jgi:hypothetical protein
MKNELDFLYLRGALFNNKYPEHAKKVFDETYQELLNRKNKEKYNSGIVNFMFCSFPLRPRWEYIREVQLNIISNSHIHSHAGAMGARKD